jgi:hypothetical protein
LKQRGADILRQRWKSKNDFLSFENCDETLSKNFFWLDKKGGKLALSDQWKI